MVGNVRWLAVMSCPEKEAVHKLEKWSHLAEMYMARSACWQHPSQASLKSIVCSSDSKTLTFSCCPVPAGSPSPTGHALSSAHCTAPVWQPSRCGLWHSYSLSYDRQTHDVKSTSRPGILWIRWTRENQTPPLTHWRAECCTTCMQHSMLRKCRDAAGMQDNVPNKTVRAKVALGWQINLPLPRAGTAQCFSSCLNAPPRPAEPTAMAVWWPLQTALQFLKDSPHNLTKQLLLQPRSKAFHTTWNGSLSGHIY